MCRFYAKLPHEEDIVQVLDYIFRLDDDSLITNNITYDMFKIHERHGQVVWVHV